MDSTPFLIYTYAFSHPDVPGNLAAGGAGSDNLRVDTRAPQSRLRIGRHEWRKVRQTCDSQTLGRFASTDKPVAVRAYNACMGHGVIADDLTGSCDVAARLTRSGYQPVVAVMPGVFGRLSRERLIRREGEMVVVNTRSRDGPLPLATDRARAAATTLERNGLPVVYQKIDSTLRGHWPEELRAIVDVSRPERVLVCPAFPAQGRIVRCGRLSLRRARGRGFTHAPGIEAARDLGEILQSRCGWLPKIVGLEVVRCGARAIRSELSSRASTRCVVFDAENDGDLRTIGHAFLKSTHRLLWVGSAGLIPYVLPKRSRSVAAPPPQPHGPWLLIQGSRHPASHVQFQPLGPEAGVRVLKLSGIPDRETMQTLFARVLAGLAGGNDVAVVAPRRFDVSVPARLPRFLGKLVRRVCATSTQGGIFVTGGNTAEAVCDSLRVTGLRVAMEICPGIALSVALNGCRPGLLLVTKAGGFGGPDEVLRILMRCRCGLSKEAMRGNNNW